MFTCPEHPQIRQANTGICPMCSKPLVQVSHKTHSSELLSSHKTIAIVISLITVVSVASSIQGGYFISSFLLPNFIAGILIVLAGTKLVDIPGFTAIFLKYDILANIVPEYALAYPFIELLLGIGYILIPQFFILQCCSIIFILLHVLSIFKVLASKQIILSGTFGSILPMPITYLTAGLYSCLTVFICILIAT